MIWKRCARKTCRMRESSNISMRQSNSVERPEPDHKQNNFQAQEDVWNLAPRFMVLS